MTQHPVPSTPPYQYPETQYLVPSTPPYQYPEILGLSTSTGGFAMTANQEFSTQYQYHPLPVPKDSVPSTQYTPLPVPKDSVPDWYPVPVPQNFLGASPRTATPPSLVSTQYPFKKSWGQPSTQPVSSSFPSTSIIKKSRGLRPQTPTTQYPNNPIFSQVSVFSVREAPEPPQPSTSTQPFSSSTR